MIVTALRFLALLVAGMALWPVPAWALDPRLEVTQYGHSVWKGVERLGRGRIDSIAQTTDGYLWLGTSSGLIRFDGVRGVPWRPPVGTLPDNRARALLGTRDGALWIATSRGLAIWKDSQLVTPGQFDGSIVNALLEDPDGTVWVAGSTKANSALLCAFRATQPVECHGSDGRFGRVIASLYRDRDGALWIGGRDRVWKWKGQREEAYDLPHPIMALRTLTETANGAMLVGTNRALLKLANGKVEPFPLPEEIEGQGVMSLLRDREGALWLGVADFGLVHIFEDRTDVFRVAEGLSGDFVLDMFEDREGNVWISTHTALNRFREATETVYSRAQGLGGRVLSVLQAKDGVIWTSTSDGLYRLDRGRFEKVAPTRSSALFEDPLDRIWAAAPTERGYVKDGRFVPAELESGGPVDAAVQDAKGNLWFAQRRAGLLRMPASGKIERVGWPAAGEDAIVSSLAVDPSGDALWIGQASGQVSKRVDDNVQPMFSLQGTAENRRVLHLRVEPDGSVWMSSRAGLWQFRNGALRRMAIAGLPCNSTYWSLAKGDSVWVYTTCGLVELDGKDVAAWSVTADVEANKVPMQSFRDRIVMQRTRIPVGQLPQTTIFTPKAVQARDGRIWIAGIDGLYVVDPTRRKAVDVRLPVHVEKLVSDGVPYSPTQALRLPPQQRDVAIEYTALAFAAPEKLRFRHKLEGRDAEWQAVGDRRVASYTDLPPGSYRFIVSAAGENGVWSKEESAIEFAIAPAWWQTLEFRAACVAAFVLLMFGLYRLRVASLARQMNATLEARVNERLRISRDLHDTLLQSFQGLLLRFQTALQLWPSPEGRDVLVKAIDQTAAAVTEGRDAVHGLRVSATEANDLAEAIRSLAQSLATEYGPQRVTDLRVEVQGSLRALHPILRDELFRIAGEAMRNAFRHAGATRIEVETRYDERELCLRVRDNGKGMDPAVMAHGGREGHFGLHGMRERAKDIGGTLAVWSGEGTGTEVELKIPARQAYALQPPAGLAVPISLSGHGAT
ncbi:hypothetical protein DSM104443_02359 [Usitatibacter rugosus]|uniref:Histidine kinase domain-containing protein n=1 Tax=Usitatibacter rugosus TaxID=2732067 RepID=A0A6M4GVS2_9PROT|nr:sensor histidine kinase [Usitatibacter rugosus]QJR11286.1 hypothetical protein DSM104443_02359 [Usitatibacter rugosus]